MLLTVMGVSTADQNPSVQHSAAGVLSDMNGMIYVIPANAPAMATAVGDLIAIKLQEWAEG